MNVLRKSLPAAVLILALLTIFGSGVALAQDSENKQAGESEVVLTPGQAFAEASLGPDSGDTAWMLISTALVLFMTLPGLALFYGGLVRAKNVLSVLMQCFALAALMTVLWVVAGYSLAFSVPESESLNRFTGDLSNVFLRNLNAESLSGTIPESVFMMFQMTFFIITPALIAGAYAERMKFSAVLLFSAFWSILVYAPVCHWVWGGGWLMEMEVLDFAGGTVVHINAGISALVAAIMLGKRKGYPTTHMPPHSMTLTVVGASMLWVGWFGFNAGSALAANGTAGMAMTVTQIASAMAALTWMFMEWAGHGKPSALGIVTGSVAGLVAITPAAGFVGPAGGLAIGFASGAICFFSATTMKRRFGYDDSLDAFGVHGVGGFVGAILTGVFVAPMLGGTGGEDFNMTAQVGKQFVGAMASVVYAGVLTFIILKAVDMTVGLRVTPEQENEGLDIVLHDERGWTL